MRKYIYLIVVLMLGITSSCNKFYTEEQYEHYVSFKAPTSTVSRIRLKYKKGEPSVYRLPLIVSGSTVNEKNLNVHFDIDDDTLEIYNYEHFYTREELYYKQLTEEYYSIPSYDVTIPAGENQALIDINFNFDGLDLSDNWVLPLIIKDDPSYNYVSNPRKNYNNALLWVTPFNDYSGKYGTTTLNVLVNDNTMPIVVSTRESYVVDEKTIFYYAGAIKEGRADRKNFKIYATFIPDSNDGKKGQVELKAADERINFVSKSNATYEISEFMDAVRPNLLRRTVIIKGIDYTFEDPWDIENEVIQYKVKGSMSMSRNINTSIDDEEYAIEWED